MDDRLVIAGRHIENRFFLGTGKFSSYEIMRQAIDACAAHIVTVALRRVEPEGGRETIMDFIPPRCIVMANTSGARTAEEAVRLARLARAMGAGDWIKIEVINDARYLLPDNQQTIRATEILAKEGFIVMPYMNPDLADARRLRDAGAASIMPLGAPIGTNKGLTTRELVRILVEEIPLPVIVDAGIGCPSQAAAAMEIGCAAVLVNTAVAIAGQPPLLAAAFAQAVAAGRAAYLAGIPAISDSAQASSPLTGFLR